MKVWSPLSSLVPREKVEINNKKFFFLMTFPDYKIGTVIFLS